MLESVPSFGFLIEVKSMLNRLLERADKQDELSQSFIARFDRQKEIGCRAFERLDELTNAHAS